MTINLCSLTVCNTLAASIRLGLHIPFLFNSLRPQGFFVCFIFFFLRDPANKLDAQLLHLQLLQSPLPPLQRPAVVSIPLWHPLSLCQQPSAPVTRSCSAWDPLHFSQPSLTQPQFSFCGRLPGWMAWSRYMPLVSRVKSSG